MCKKRAEQESLSPSKPPCHENITRRPQQSYIVLVTSNGPEDGGFQSRSRKRRYDLISAILHDPHDPDPLVGVSDMPKVPQQFKCRPGCECEFEWTRLSTGRKYTAWESKIQGAG